MVKARLWDETLECQQFDLQVNNLYESETRNSQALKHDDTAIPHHIWRDAILEGVLVFKGSILILDQALDKLRT